MFNCSEIPSKDRVWFNNGIWFNKDCMEVMLEMSDDSVSLTLTDIPYDSVNRTSNGLRNLNKKNADVLTFDLYNFLQEVYRVTKSTVIIFCGREQMSIISGWFTNKQGTTRQLIWEKTNPSPMNGQYVYLSGIENAVWFKKSGGVFNAHCKNTVFRYPNGRNKIHPTEKNHKLLQELILDNSNEGDVVFDPCAGSGSTLLVAQENKRHFIGCELDKNYFDKGAERLKTYG